MREFGRSAEGSTAPPDVLLAALSRTDVLVGAAAKDRDMRKKLRAAQAKALTALSQRVRKHIAPFEKWIVEYRKVCYCR